MNENIDSLFKDGIQGLEGNPPDVDRDPADTWDSLAHQLDRRKRRGSWWQIGAAATVVLLLGAAWFISQNEPNENHEGWAMNSQIPNPKEIEGRYDGPEHARQRADATTDSAQMAHEPSNISQGLVHDPTVAKPSANQPAQQEQSKLAANKRGEVIIHNFADATNGAVTLSINDADFLANTTSKITLSQSAATQK
ncbi:MAG: hypothetical protein AAF570_07310, partial [Bacteroidota bacterium]